MNKYITSEENTHPTLACIVINPIDNTDGYLLTYYGEGAESVEVWSLLDAEVLIKYFLLFNVPVASESLEVIQKLEPLSTYYNFTPHYLHSEIIIADNQ